MEKDELTIIKEIRDRFSFSDSSVIGIGDDSAVLKFINSALLTTDLMIEDIHFDLSYSSFYHLGFKIVSVNVSDIYAMGGDFKGFLFSLGIPETIEDNDLRELFDGIEDALKHYGGILVGGDLSKSEKVILSGFATGETDNPVLRKGAEAGDWIFITSYLGLSAAGLYALKNFSDDEKKVIKSIRNFENFKAFDSKFVGIDRIGEVLQRHLLPHARQSHQFRHLAKAMMDISDGLLIDLYRLCEENNVGAEIYIDKLPVHSVVTRVSECLSLDPMNLILSGGEDYELLVVSHREDIATSFGLIPVGRIIEDRGIYLIDLLKRRIPARPEGWQHFQQV
ncbi:thiamine-phosphate kinase [Thermodesulfovibrio thiophilus]|uniref:thiamine-phosphate kinase n=1 Tax=Thermodesulfovibrio thiophilus TaxID=340095 RepID=UPI000407ADD0|nr:thiamine-phosphate kinase [Thermodesulfovibrio thiophilus]